MQFINLKIAATHLISSQTWRLMTHLVAVFISWISNRVSFWNFFNPFPLSPYWLGADLDLLFMDQDLYHVSICLWCSGVHTWTYTPTPHFHSNHVVRQTLTPRTFNPSWHISQLDEPTRAQSHNILVSYQNGVIMISRRRLKCHLFDGWGKNKARTIHTGKVDFHFSVCDYMQQVRQPDAIPSNLPLLTNINLKSVVPF